MKVSNKMKIISMVAITITAIVTIACATVSNPNDEPSSIEQWQQKYPQVFNNVGYSKLIESAEIKSKKIAELEQKIVSVTNKFGIYDPVLQYLITHISNESMLYASIRFQQYNELMYMSDSVESAVYYAREGNLPLHCMDIISIAETSKTIKNISQIMDADAFYRARITQTENRLNLKLIGPNMPYSRMDTFCKTGNY
jgi:hypothetical protein